MTPETLIALACMISNKGPIDTTAMEAQLNADEQSQVAAIIQSGACLPDKLEQLLVETKAKFDKGDLPILASGGSPTTMC